MKSLYSAGPEAKGRMDSTSEEEPGLFTALLALLFSLASIAFVVGIVWGIAWLVPIVGSALVAAGRSMARLVVLLLAVGCAILTIRLKYSLPWLYWRVELGVGLVTTWQATPAAFDRLGWGPLAAIGGGIYLMVRALDNRRSAVQAKATLRPLALGRSPESSAPHPTSPAGDRR